MCSPGPQLCPAFWRIVLSIVGDVQWPAIWASMLTRCFTFPNKEKAFFFFLTKQNKRWKPSDQTLPMHKNIGLRCFTRTCKETDPNRFLLAQTTKLDRLDVFDSNGPNGLISSFGSPDTRVMSSAKVILGSSTTTCGVRGDGNQQPQLITVESVEISLVG